jgi:hypothetical protein
MIFVNLECIIFTVLPIGEHHVVISIYVINSKYRTESLYHDFFGARKTAKEHIGICIRTPSCPCILEANRINPSKLRHYMTSLTPWCRAYLLTLTETLHSVGPLFLSLSGLCLLRRCQSM